MSDEKVVRIYPAQWEGRTKSEDDALRLERRDEMVEVLQSMRGRVEGLEIEGMIVIALSVDPSQDSIFISSRMNVDPTRTVGVLEFVKQGFILPRYIDVED